MNIYERRATVTVSGGSANLVTLNVRGGLLNQFLVRALSTPATSQFQASLVDENSIVRLNYDYHTGEINDLNVGLPMVGVYTVNIVNASSADTFDVVLSIRE